MYRRLLFSVLCALLATVAATAGEKTKVACIGNSITYGYLLDDPATQSYPARLQALLGDGYEVGNFGKSGATLLRKGHRPYFEQPEFRAAMNFKPDIAVIHLGVNDTDPRNWPNYSDEFVGDYLALIDSVRTSNPDVRILIARLTPIGASHYRFRSGTRQWLREIQTKIDPIAQAAGVEVIDFDTPLRNRQNLMPDAIHPNAEGAQLLAEEVRGAITGRWGPLRIPTVWQSGMVVQRGRFIPLEGIADAGAKIAVTFDGVTKHTVADNRGRWQVMLPPAVGGHSYNLKVTDGTTTLNLTDILGGEVWVASGQSNMEFPLRSDADFDKAIASADDSLLRIYNMCPVDRTDNRQWSDSVIAAIDHLEHYKPSRWEKSSPLTASDLSAVAYYFARQLRDSLQVPVGIISNAVGGSTIASWIDVTTLEDNIPEILVNWRSNDYIQPWAQQRANCNTGPDHPRSRHPYEPGYLFAAGIEPLGHLPVAGVVWYQGESDAHNPDIYAQLFPLWTSSWRRHFGDKNMPVIFAQLSSIERPSWPSFRDLQRRLDETDPWAFMAVTFDVGDSLDVHPRMKMPVGRRMARHALRNLYGYDSLESYGPRPVAAVADHRSAVIVTFDNAEGLTTADGSAPRTFEIAETDGIYRPAVAEIVNGNKIKLYNTDMTNPRYVRYGWQPFSRANLVNGEGIPASTFSIEAVDADPGIEEGLEVGVSGQFAAIFGDDIIMAGGCNFPTDPLGPASKKKFYQGIYRLPLATMKPQRIGSLPAPSAYGGAVAVADGVVLVGGTPDGVATNRVELLRIVPSGASVSQLPSLPVAIDNMAVAAIGSRIYVAGGNAAGAPSNDLYMIDLSAGNAAKWKKLRPMPGNPRVQPVMAAAIDASGEEMLYLWGGFAPRYGKNEPTLQLDGLRYSPSQNRWTAIEGPTAPDGDPVSVGGGSATALPDGRIAICGGVNKDVFLEALRNQAPDYLMHPVEWYRFNPYIFIYDPQTARFQQPVASESTARAGATMMAAPDGRVFVIGGEVKPRIRTSEFTEIKNL